MPPATTGHRSFAACAYDTSMQHRVENGFKQLLDNGPLYKKVGTAVRCLVGLRIEDFPIEMATDVKLLCLISSYIQYAGEFPIYSGIPPRLRRKGVAALYRINKLLVIAKGAASVLNITEKSKIDTVCRQQLSIL